MGHQSDVLLWIFFSSIDYISLVLQWQLQQVKTVVCPAKSLCRNNDS